MLSIYACFNRKFQKSRIYGCLLPDVELPSRLKSRQALRSGRPQNPLLQLHDIARLNNHLESLNEEGVMNSTSITSMLRGRLRPRGHVPWTSDWVCKTCRTKTPVRLSSTSSDVSFKKPYYITSPIFYVNAGKHLPSNRNKSAKALRQLLMSATSTLWSSRTS